MAVDDVKICEVVLIVVEFSKDYMACMVRGLDGWGKLTGTWKNI